MRIGLTARDGASPRSGVTPSPPAAAFERVFTLVSDLVVVTRREGTILLANPAWEATLGWTVDEVVGRSVFEFIHPEDVAASRRAAIDAGSVAYFTNRCRHKDGEWRWLLWSGRLDGDVWYAVAKDVTEQLSLERRALYDQVTGLANRALLLDHLGGAMARLRRNGDTSKLLAVLFLDLDGFKLVNDGLGHEAGDAVLTGVARRLRSVVTDTDMISRFGGDEFVVVAESLRCEDESLALGERIVELIGREFELPTGACTLSCSVGVATTRDPGTDPDAILRDADDAMYRAKMRGRGRAELFDARARVEVAERIELERELRQALISDQLKVAYQPVMSVADGTMAGCEALVRWAHPEQGWMLPDRFVPMAEATGLIIPLGELVLNEACRQAGLWRREGREFTVSVNVSRRQLLESGFVELVRSALRRGGVPGRAICLEVTETAAPVQHSGIVEVLQEVRRLGCRIALDDFGAGYSTLTDLRELPIDVIKIDKSFVGGVADNGDDRGIVAAVIALARELGLTVIAEGVEDERQLSVLRTLDCPLAQGHLFSAAVMAHELIDGGFSPRPQADRRPAPGITRTRRDRARVSTPRL
jgi:diguanylate cyclase (GGDEF)-like protein/PAS domain S-box-containing protein